MCRRLYGDCVFTKSSKAALDLANELISATKTPLFAANVASLSADFEERIAPYESAYFAAMSNGEYRPYSDLHNKHVVSAGFSKLIASLQLVLNFPWAQSQSNWVLKLYMLSQERGISTSCQSGWARGSGTTMLQLRLMRSSSTVECPGIW